LRNRSPRVEDISTGIRPVPEFVNRAVVTRGLVVPGLLEGGKPVKTSKPGGGATA
jgi:hypothetical protein